MTQHPRRIFRSIGTVLALCLGGGKLADSQLR